MEEIEPPGGRKLPEQPSPNAELKLSVGSLPPQGSLTGLVPAGQAHYLITTFGIVLAAAAGIGGAVLTLHVTSDALTVYSELAFALIAVALIAICGGRTVTETKHVEGEPGSQGTGAQ